MDWYVLRSKPNKELTLSRELEARGFEYFYPQLHVKPVNPRNRRIRPYFPGYMFLHTDLGCYAASAFEWFPFSLGMVSFDGMPAVVPEGLVQTIRKYVDAINAAGREQFESLQRGDEVLVQGGPFDGYEAIFDARLAGGERIRVFLKLLQVRQVKLELPAIQIRRLRPTQTC